MNGRDRGDNIKADLKEIRCGMDSSASRHRSVAGSCKYGNLPSGSIKGGDYQFLKKDSAPWI
jgi:hypothetical protein